MSETREHHHEGPTRTQLYCHDCGKNFIAEIDYSVNGNHILECAHCGHEHCRVIENGKVTEDRWSSRWGNDKQKDGIRARRVWKANGDVLQARTSSFSHFLAEKWLNRAQL